MIMESDKLPIKSLFFFNWLLAIAISIFILFFLLVGEKSMTHVIISTIMSAMIVLLIGQMHILIMILARRYFGVKSKIYKRQRYLYSFLYCAVIHLFMGPIFSFFAGVYWDWGNVTVVMMFITSSFLFNALIIIVQDFIILQSRKSQTDLENSYLKTAHAEAVNLLLKQQIHPHFLFNALNTLKSLYKKDTKLGETYLVHLAGFLRATISNHQNTLSTLKDELTLCADYMQMQKIRFGAALSYIVVMPEDQKNQGYLPSFSLQPLLENAIKHNELTDEAPLHITLTRDKDRIIVVNNFQMKHYKESSTSSGLANLSKRYRLFSNDEVLITDDGTTFSVSVKIFKDADSNN